MTAEQGRAPHTYEGAVSDLARALAATWHACEATGADLPEALSYALGLAALALAKEIDPATAGIDPERAGRLLVVQRPGSWEADLVARLVYPVDLPGP